MARGHHPLLRHAAAVARRLPMKGSHETTHKQTLQFRMQSQADTQLQQQLQGILRHTCHIHWHTCLNSFGSHAALVAAISNLCFVTHFEFVTVDVDQNMVTKRPYNWSPGLSLNVFCTISRARPVGMGLGAKFGRKHAKDRKFVMMGVWAATGPRDLSKRWGGEAPHSLGWPPGSPGPHRSPE